MTQSLIKSMTRAGAVAGALVSTAPADAARPTGLTARDYVNSYNVASGPVIKPTVPFCMIQTVQEMAVPEGKAKKPYIQKITTDKNGEDTIVTSAMRRIDEFEQGTRITYKAGEPQPKILTFEYVWKSTDKSLRGAYDVVTTQAYEPDSKEILVGTTRHGTKALPQNVKTVQQNAETTVETFVNCMKQPIGLHFGLTK